MLLYYRPVYACCICLHCCRCHIQTQRGEYQYIQVHIALTLIALLHSCPGTHCQHNHQDNGDMTITATTVTK
ncbi:hypothetical protein BJY52DRAFT_1305454 [Lactarius psammicola]|nr:hypothetical protein BJY52DRAFT_1305454 [Lactarius psammicola]